MIDIRKLKIKSGDTVECIATTSAEHSPGYELGRVFTVDHFVISGFKQLLYDSMGNYVFTDEVAICSKVEELSTEERNKQALTRILNVVFPDNWCFEEPGPASTGRYVTVRFPEFVITNSRRETHTIRGLYVRVSMDSEWCIGSPNIVGLRGTLLERELNSGYRHSHLPSASTFTGYSTFCLGGDMIAELGTLLRHKNVYEEEDMYENYFETLNTYVRWESLEGGPYRSIASITNSVRSEFYSGEPVYPSCTTANKSSTYLFLVELIKKYGIELPIVLNITESRALEDIMSTISVDVDELNSRLRPFIIEDLNDKRLKDVLCLEVGGCRYRSNTGNIQVFKNIVERETVPDIEITQVSSRTSGYYFKGEPIPNITLRERGAELYGKANIRIARSVLVGFCKDLMVNFYGKFYEEGYSTLSASHTSEPEHESCVESIG